ncbi:MAG: phosphatidate cytidylyltransferase [Treponema sp.]|nr:phosphatidate cytidylyltransferase [Treponema sp.]
MKKLIERLLIFFIGIPAVFALVLFLPYYSNLALNLVVIFFSGIGAVEFSSMLEKKNIRISKIESFILGALAPLAVTLNISFGLPEWIVPAIIMAGAGWSLVSRVFSRVTELDNITNQITGGFALLLYPGFFMCWLVYMSGWGNPSAILLFLLITFGNDSIAWLFGTLFGANNRGIIAVSPNKSIAGFIGGLLGSLIVAIGAVFVFPHIFPICTECTPFIYLLIYASFIGFCAGIAAMLGDLAESAIKRSCDFVDSGNFILGRGGVLDSIDSIAFAAPMFYLLFSFFFNV